jgi:hypothetical protein
MAKILQNLILETGLVIRPPREGQIQFAFAARRLLSVGANREQADEWYDGSPRTERQ